MFNISIIECRLVKDPEFKYLNGTNTAVCNMRVAFDGPPSKKQDNESNFIDVVAWEKLAENCANNLKKGRHVLVQGTFRIRKYTTQDGVDKYTPEIVASRVQFLDRPDSAGNTQHPANEAAAGSDDLGGINLDDMPF
jgi:single-strand DNA-binding protein